MEFRDYYDILGVSKTASADEIKKAYRKLARKYHPDVSKEKDAEKRMQEVNEAYAVLFDTEKRAAYDNLGSHQPGEEFRPPPGWDAGYVYSGKPRGGSSANFSDFFASMFGSGGGRGDGRDANFQMRGEDRHAHIVIDLKDTYHGAIRTITLRASHLDDSGHVVTDDIVLNVKIPKGVKEGQNIRLVGKGNPGIGGEPAGDLFLEVQFRTDPHYRVHERDVYETVEITPWEAALGASIEVPTPSGKVKVTVPAHCKSGRKLRLKGRGIPADPPGDLYLELQITLPPADSEKARQLYETMAREMPFNPRQTTGA